MLALLGACYAPAAYRACEISCATGVCPAGLTCGVDDQLCYAPGGSTCSEPQPDTAPSCVGTVGLVQTYCPPQPIAAEQVLATAGTASTDGGNCIDVIQQPNGPALCVFAVAKVVRMDAAMTFTGSRPVVFVATEDIIINATLDVSRGGAGYVPAAVPSGFTCLTGTAKPAQSTPVLSGGAGGGGGGFATAGGLGGQVINEQGTPAGPATKLPTIVRPGCPGGASGGNVAGAFQAPGGAPGGGVYLLAGSRITVNGQIHAFGDGGAGTNQANVGGGGGGSGGMIVLDAPMVTLAATAKVLAAGGGGGEGSASVQSNAGGRQSTQMPTEPAPGGTGTAGSDGGNGSGSINPATQNGAPADGVSGGGGGGGGAGYIKVFGLLTIGGVVAPPPT